MRPAGDSGVTRGLESLCHAGADCSGWIASVAVLDFRAGVPDMFRHAFLLLHT